MDAKLVQLLNANDLIDVKSPKISIDARLVQPQNKYSSMIVTFYGIVIDVKLAQSLNTNDLIEVKSPKISIDARLAQP